MTITISIKRTDSWVLAQRLETGANVSDTLKIDVDPADLSREARDILLTYGGGKYISTSHLTFDKNYKRSERCHCYGSEYFQIESNDPSMEEIDHAIRSAAQRIEEKCAKRQAEQIQREQEQQQKQADMDAARTLLARELETLENGLKYARRTNEERQQQIEAYETLVAIIAEDNGQDIVTDAIARMAQAEVNTSVDDVKETLADLLNWNE